MSWDDPPIDDSAFRRLPNEEIDDLYKRLEQMAQENIELRSLLRRYQQRALSDEQSWACPDENCTEPTCLDAAVRRLLQYEPAPPDTGETK